MAEVMQFFRELLEGQPPEAAIQVTVTHAVRVFTDDPSDPAIYELQGEVGGYIYTSVVFTRDQNFIMGIPMGIQVLLSRPIPGAEGYPIFLKLSSMQIVNPHTPPAYAHQAQAPVVAPVPPAQPMQVQPEPMQVPVAPPMPAPIDNPLMTTEIPFDANANDKQRQQEIS